MNIMAILGWLLFGLIIGALARFILPGRQNMNLIMTMGLGVVGSFAGGFLASLIPGLASGEGFVQPGGWISSTIGALVVLFLYSRFVANK